MNWTPEHEAMHAALVEALGEPAGERGRSQKAYRNASRRLSDAGVVPEAMDKLLRDYAAATLSQLGPMPLAVFLDGRLKLHDLRHVGLQRWASECLSCEREIERGELVWLRKDSEGHWLVTCSECEDIDHRWERAASARAHALERDGDPEQLLEAILEHTPRELREVVEDDLSLFTAALDA
jgi:hypothetical protein